MEFFHYMNELQYVQFVHVYNNDTAVSVCIQIEICVTIKLYVVEILTH